METVIKRTYAELKLSLIKELLMKKAQELYGFVSKKD